MHCSRQEYLCSFEAPVLGRRLRSRAAQNERGRRITRVPYDPRYPVYTGWDYGFSDSHGHLVRAQIVGRGSASSTTTKVWVPASTPHEGAQDVVHLRGAFGPHDGASGNVGTGKNIAEVASEYGVQFTIVPRMPVSDGRQCRADDAARCVFDAQKCERGIDALVQLPPQMGRRSQDPLGNAGARLVEPRRRWDSHAGLRHRRERRAADGARKRETPARPDGWGA